MSQASDTVHAILLLYVKARDFDYVPELHNLSELPDILNKLESLMHLNLEFTNHNGASKN